MYTHDTTRCFLIATQPYEAAPYILLCHEDEDKCIMAVSRDTLLSMCDDTSITLCNVSKSEVLSGVFKAPLEEYSEVHLNSKTIRLHHAPILWDILSLLIEENAFFRIPGVQDQVFTFSDISFSMKTDEVSISFYDKGIKRVYTLWSTPNLNMSTSSGYIDVKCSDRVKRLLGKHSDDSSTTNYFTDTGADYITLNLAYLACTWNTRYCLKRFHVAELSYLLEEYETARAEVLGMDLAKVYLENKNVEAETLFSHINGKSISSTCTIAFVIALKFPDILAIAKAFSRDRATIMQICKSENALHLLKHYIVTHVTGTITTCYLDDICNSFIQSVLNSVNVQELITLQQKVTYLACQIFQYKMAYVNPIINIPEKVQFKDGLLLIYKGGAIC